MADEKVETTLPEHLTVLSDDALEVAHKLLSEAHITKAEAAKLSEALLNITQNNQILRAVISCAPDGFAVKDNNGVLDFISYNKGFCLEQAENGHGIVVPVKVVEVAKKRTK